MRQKALSTRLKGNMIKKTNLLASLFLLLILVSSAHAGSYSLIIKSIDCDKCIQKIHDYFEKNLGARVQNLKIDKENNMVTFDSISIDQIEMDNIRKGLEMLGFKVTTESKMIPTTVKQTVEEKKP